MKPTNENAGIFAGNDLNSKNTQDILESNLQVPTTYFNPKTLEKLSILDKQLFNIYGKGSKVETPYACLHHAFEAQVKLNPKNVAATYEGQKITYRDLDQQANYLAAILTEHGVKPGDNIGLYIQRSIPMLIGILASLKIGAAYVPQHIGVAPESQLNFVTKKANTKVILTISKFKHLVPVPENHTCLAIDDIIEEAGKDWVNKEFTPNRPVTKDDSCFILFTSGTTGNPNGVQVSHKNVCNVVLNEPGNLNIVPCMKVGQILSIAFDMAAWEIFGCLCNGGTLLIRGKSITETAERAHVIIATPSVLGRVNRKQCKNIMAVAVAGEPCPAPLVEKWAPMCDFYNSCGPTETTIVNTMQLCKPSAEAPPIGKPIPNNTVYILDENMQPLPIGEVGVMWGGGTCVTDGYLANDELNARKYAYDPFLNDGSLMFHTGDLGRWNKDGELEHHGRVDDQVKVNGFRIELDSVSNAIEASPLCRKAVTLKYDNKSLVAFLSPACADIEEAKQSVADNLPYYCVPSVFIPMDKFPTTSRGKIDKRKLLEIAKIEKEKHDLVSFKEQYEKVELPKQGSWLKKLWKSPRFMEYNRLAVLVGLVNVAVFIHALTKGNWWAPEGIALAKISNVVIVNFFMAIIVRQQYVINMFFGIATSFARHWPLSVRRRMGKVYHFGGMHLGGNISGTIWFTLFLGSLFYQHFNSGIGTSTALIGASASLVVLLVAIIIMSLPKFRAKFHDNFERMHRFGGWTALLLFWIQTVLFIKAQSHDQWLGSSLASTPAFWLLGILTISIAIPWMYLRKVNVEIDKPSSHVAIAKFNYGVTPFAGSSMVLSTSPLKEWHAFANVPSPNSEGYRLTISRAGDWTGKFIDEMPSKIWVKGIPTAGVGNIDKLFKRVVWVATGSGIGPCLPHLLTRDTPSKLVWATRNPVKTYGSKLVDEILSVQDDPIIWDTDKDGKPDMVKLAYLAYKQFDAEAVICISNRKLTWQVVTGMETRGIPAYGAIWDS